MSVAPAKKPKLDALCEPVGLLRPSDIPDVKIAEFVPSSSDPSASVTKLSASVSNLSDPSSGNDKPDPVPTNDSDGPGFLGL